MVVASPGPLTEVTMSFRALFYAYVLGGLTFIPLVILILVAIAIYTSVPVQIDSAKDAKPKLHTESTEPQAETEEPASPLEVNDQPKARKGWLTMRRTFEESTFDGSYVTLVRSYLDARSKDPKRSRPKDMWYVVLKGKVLYLYEDENMTECEAAVELGGHEVSISPEGLLDGELYTRRNAICLRPRQISEEKAMPSVTKEMTLEEINVDEKMEEAGGSLKKRTDERERLVEEEKHRDFARQEAFSTSTPWFIFVRSCVEMEDWYLALVHASENPTGTPTLDPLQSVFLPSEMNQLVVTLDEQPDVIPMRWLNALLGRIFFSFYRTQSLESYIIGRLMKKLSKVKRPTFLTDISVTKFSIGNKAPTLSKPMLKELTKEGDASLEVRLSYKGEIRATVEATATINLGARFKSYAVKLVLAVILREIDGNLLIKVKRPPSSRIWYAFTQTPRVVIDVEPIVSDRQITWGMILDTIKSRIIEVIQESVVMPNMDDISFFDSSQYEHRGGLWSDAARRKESEPASTSSEAEGVKPAASESDLPSISATSEEVTAPTIQQSLSTEGLGVEVSSSRTVPIILSATAEAPESNTKASRRRSWFSSGGDDSDVGEEEVDESGVRGRQSRASSSSTPKQELPANSPDKPAVEMELDEETPGYLSPQYHGRSSSTHSQARSRSSRADSISSSVSIGGEEFSSSLSDSGTTSKSPQHSVGSSTTSSFLSTLKSKAADKQALSNSAKETMRKWGVNWGSLKKDNSANSQEDVPDVGPSDARIRTESPHGRPSYAEVRAAVAERRERRDDGGSAPIPIPNGNGKRSKSPSSSRITSSTGAPASPSHMMQGGSSEGSSKFVAPSMSRSTTENAMSDPLKDRDFTDVTEEARRPSIIHTQPSQARTMTIPGIHASHRGEPMSMGNIAPSSSPPESKSKGPAIQSMYRLWKSPILTGQQQGSDNQSTPTRTDTEERNADVAPLSLSADIASPPPRPVPPPLPPRTISSAVAAARTPDSSKDYAVPSISEEMGGGSPVQGSSVQSAEPVETSPPVGTPESVIAKGGDNRPPLPPRKVPAPA
ncbi:uncharacterized protein EDB91DRAFT_1095645 [Suillus paluster]|uniref:uncharacterized protein n=1 Tax=Suillus paluster TaxID=48578 RepID=UPI001B86A6E8|nr:uncharacterized protein EDB91DRAFT_1095645 [Suillus paluster]KAG1754802.1 hypothetical protein EDB91DRAFT_1095645 [Suillus paluster]